MPARRRPRAEPPPEASPPVPAVRAPPEAPRREPLVLPPVQDVPAWQAALAAYPDPPASLDTAQRRLYGEMLCQLCKDEKVALVVCDALLQVYAQRLPAHEHAKLTPVQVIKLQRQFANGTPLHILMQQYALSRASIYRYLQET
jgi:hypothetical protein